MTPGRARILRAMADILSARTLPQARFQAPQDAEQSAQNARATRCRERFPRATQRGVPTVLSRRGRTIP